VTGNALFCLKLLITLSLFFLFFLLDFVIYKESITMSKVKKEN